MIKNRSDRLAYLLQLVITFVWVLALSFNISAASHQKTFHFNVSPNGYPPYLIVEQEQPSGIIWDVVSLIGQRLNYNVVPKKIPRKRVDEMLLDGVIDGTSRAREWTENPNRFLFTDSVVPIEEVFFVPRESKLEYRSPQDLYSKTVVTHLAITTRNFRFTLMPKTSTVSMFRGIRTCLLLSFTETALTQLSPTGW